ncbi:MAG: hypothetical protein R2839_03390 [Thermomicrobiales bacterium]
MTILVVVFPLVHIELKRRGSISGKRSTRSTATSAIRSGPDSGLFDYVNL